MYFFDKGAAMFEIGNEKHLIESGCCMIVPPGFMHPMLPMDTKLPVFRELFFTINNNKLKESVLQLGYSPAMDCVAVTLFDNICKLGNTRIDQMQNYANDFLAAMLSHMHMSIETPDVLSLNKQQINTDGYSNITKSVIVYIEKYYMKRISIDEIAEILSYNKSYLCTLFKKETGITINDYLNLIRINEMTHFLSFTNMTIATLCHTCGFQSASHFNRTFKQFMGVSPSVYKMKLAEQENGESKNSNYSEISSKLLTLLEQLGISQESFSVWQNRVKYIFHDS